MSEASVQSNNTASSMDINDYQLKRAASNDIDEARDAKLIKLDHVDIRADTDKSKDATAAEEAYSQVEIDPAVAAAAAAATAAAAAHHQQQQENPNTDTSDNNTNNNSNNNNSTNHLITMAAAHPNVPPPPGLQLLTDPQQQQLLQSYVQAQAHAQGQDLANLTASSLAQAMVSPIAVPSLASNLLQQLQQGGNVITALPGPPQMPGASPPHIHPHLQQQPQNANGVVDDNNSNGMKRANARTLSNDERRQRRLLRNRVAAKECRKKKKQHIHEMEEKIVQLEEENAKLKSQVEELQAKLSTGGSLGGSESYRLMKEVEELNAKLGMGVPLPNGNAITAAVIAAAQQQQQQQACKLEESPQTPTVSSGTPSSTTSTPPITSTSTTPTISNSTSTTTHTTQHNDITVNETNNIINNSANNAIAAESSTV